MRFHPALIAAFAAAVAPAMMTLPYDSAPIAKKEALAQPQIPPAFHLITPEFRNLFNGMTVPKYSCPLLLHRVCCMDEPYYDGANVISCEYCKLSAA